MGITAKLGIGAALVAVGLAGLAYTMPLISNEIASKEPVYREDDVPAYPRSLVPYTIVEMASAAVLTGGIALCAIGHSEALTGPTPRSQAEIKENGDDTKDKEKTEGA